MKKCKKCGSPIPRKIVVDGREYDNYNKRSYCYQCWPVGKSYGDMCGILFTDKKSNVKRGCIRCGKEITSKNMCNACAVTLSRQKKWKIFRGKIMGRSCAVCGYSVEEKFLSALEWHHVEDKEALVSRMMNYGWDRILREAKKCLPLCGTCHNEITFGIKPKKEVEEKLKEFWDARKTLTDKLSGGVGELVKPELC